MNSKRRANPVIQGRRVCSGPCGRWRPIHEFAHRAESRAQSGVYVLGVCSPCHRSIQRQWYRRNRLKHIENVKRWKTENPELVQRYRENERSKEKTPEARAKERERSRRRYRDPVTGPLIREYHRIYKNMKRAEANIGNKEKIKGSRVKAYFPNDGGGAKKGDEEMVPREPFAKWLTGADVLRLGGIEALASAVGIDSAVFRRLINGSYSKGGRTYVIDKVTVDLVDRSLVKSGSEIGIWELYPSLYE